MRGGASGNASAVGPHEKPMKKDSDSSRRIELEDVLRSAGSAVGDLLLPSSEGWKNAENANGVEVAIVEDDDGSWTGSGRRGAGAPDRSSL